MRDGVLSSGWDVLGTSHEALRTAVRAVPADSWHLPTPCKGWSVAQIFQHAVGDQIGYAAAMTGDPSPGFNPFEPSGEMEEADPKAFLEDALTHVAKAWQTGTPPRCPCRCRPTSCPLGPARRRAGYAWDIAVATDRPSPLTPEPAPLLKIAREIAEPLRPRTYTTALPPSRATTT